MVPGSRAKFGNFAQLAVQGDLERHRARPEPCVSLTHDDERTLVKAFEEMRDGHAPDRLLWDKSFAESFHRVARRKGVHAPGRILTRRLINIRKNKARYLKYGIAILPSTVQESHPSISPRYAHAVEFALVRLRYLYGASIDDILIEPDLGQEFVDLASRMAPGLGDIELRLGALCIRKSRFEARRERTLFEDLNLNEIEPALSLLGNFAEANVDSLPEDVGLIVVGEESRWLYVARNTCLREGAKELVRGPALDVMANHFWRPDRNRLVLRVLVGPQFEKVGVVKWQMKLIEERSPVFNWPVCGVA